MTKYDDANQPASHLVILGVWQWPLTYYDDANQPARPLVIQGVWQWPLTNYDDADQPANHLVILGVRQWPLTKYNDADQPASPLVTVYWVFGRGHWLEKIRNEVLKCFLSSFCVFSFKMFSYLFEFRIFKKSLANSKKIHL